MSHSGCVWAVFEADVFVIKKLSASLKPVDKIEFFSIFQTLRKEKA